MPSWTANRLSIADLELGHVPRVALPVNDAEVAAELEPAARVADILELRIDQFAAPGASSVAALCRGARRHGKPLLATVRRHDEGGARAIAEEERLALYEAALPYVDAVDVELAAPIRADVVARAAARQIPAIVSFHDFRGTPTEAQLAEIVATGRQCGAQVVKIATLATEPADVDRLLGLLRAERAGNFIAIAMGAHGAASRVFFPLLGSLLTYAFLHRAAAPGQLSIGDLAAQLRRYSPDYARIHPH
jgi:3-dehydroquinate dehydratase I